MVAVEIILIPILFLLTFRFFQNANVLLIYACAVSVILYLLIVNGFKRIVTAIVYRSLQVYDAQLWSPIEYQQKVTKNVILRW